MGRVLSDVRRRSAIAWWRDRLSGMVAGKRPTAGALASAFGLDLTRNRDHVADATRELTVIWALLKGEQSEALDTWVGRRLVDRGYALLLDEPRRRAVLAHIRDIDRRAREKQAATRQVNLQVSEETARRLRRFARDAQAPNLGDAIEMLLKGQQSKPHRKQPSPAVTQDQPSLSLLMPQDGLGDHPQPNRRNKPKARQ